MALSSSSVQQAIIDDTHPLTCVIQATETDNDHVVYIIRVQRGIDSKYSWIIRRRYNQFNDLYNQLKPSNYELPLPPKKAFGNMKREFLSTRQIGLQEFMDKILSNLMLANTIYVKRFLDEENYLQNFRELSLAHVSMFFRSESNWQISEQLNEIGWRFRKQNILLKNSESPQNKFLLTWCEHGPDKCLKEAELKLIFQQLTQIQHEHIEPIIRIHTGDTSTIIIQRFSEKLISLKDYICGVSKINNSFIKKYALQKSYQTLPVTQIQFISKQILLALQFIYSKGLFYGHLHSGNVLLDQNGTLIKLNDIANSLLGLPYYLRSFVVEQRKVNNLELVDVYGFGHILYEMTYGEPLLTDSSKLDFNTCPDREIKAILDQLLLEDSIKSGLPCIDELLALPFFQTVNVNSLPTSSSSAAAYASNSNNKLFTSSKVKEYLARSREFIEKRLNEEQKVFYKLKRRNLAEAKVLSEDEIRKRRKEKKKADKEGQNSLEFPTLLENFSRMPR